ncbi:MAG TPA: alpha/beta fold hydrolase [Terriglobales bacterium]|jgi:pimeloyl-ACP methyl ester carboxylesterase
MPSLESPRKDIPQIEECWATIDGARMRYQRAGSGPPLILVHGLLGYSFSWRFNIPVLAEQATVYAIDMLGAGFSDRCPGMDCTFQGCAARLLRFVEHLGISSFDLLGTSHGGAVAMTAASMARPGQVRRLILVDAVNPYSPHGRFLTSFLSGRIVSFLFRALFPRLTVAHPYVLLRLYGDATRIAPGTLEGYSKPFAIPGSLEYGLKVISTWVTDLRELESILPKLAEIPTLILWGNRDKAVNPASALLLRQHFRNSQLLVFDGVGHLPYEESPEEFNRAVIQFLRCPA